MVLTRAASKRQRERLFSLTSPEATQWRMEFYRMDSLRNVVWQRAEDVYLQTLYDTIEQPTGFPKGVVNITRDYCTVSPLAITLLVTGPPPGEGPRLTTSSGRPYCPIEEHKRILDHPEALWKFIMNLRYWDGAYYDRMVYTVETTTNLKLRDIIFTGDTVRNISDWFFPSQVVIRRAFRQ